MKISFNVIGTFSKKSNVKTQKILTIVGVPATMHPMYLQPNVKYLSDMILGHLPIARQEQTYAMKNKKKQSLVLRIRDWVRIRIVI